MTSTHRLAAVGIVWAVLALVSAVTLMQSLFMAASIIALLVVVYVVAALAATYLILRVGPAR